MYNLLYICNMKFFIKLYAIWKKKINFIKFLYVQKGNSVELKVISQDILSNFINHTLSPLH